MMTKMQQMMNIDLFQIFLFIIRFNLFKRLDIINISKFYLDLIYKNMDD